MVRCSVPVLDPVLPISPSEQVGVIAPAAIVAGTITPVQQVVAWASVKHVVSDAAHEYVIASVTEQPILTVIPKKIVIPAPADDEIISRRSAERSTC